ncbi:hypothetical protein Goklo_015976 [Gossypium klotzschianum]|uniref:Uncharacterized protein n=1 Tax=Gossypium klotzschianum TaxID=34286 RepID=A0A7J8UCT9_9ROSI|nr:hypothetical protein [Gossypium klotzschianum]
MSAGLASWCLPVDLANYDRQWAWRRRDCQRAWLIAWLGVGFDRFLLRAFHVVDFWKFVGQMNCLVWPDAQIIALSLGFLFIHVLVQIEKSKFQKLKNGGCYGLCDMGTCHFSFPGLFSCFFVFWAYAACLYPSMHHNAIASLHENHKASKVGQEKEKKDASSIIYLELLEAWISLKGTKFCGANLRFIDHCIRTTHALVYFKYVIVAEAS